MTTQTAFPPSTADTAGAAPNLGNDDRGVHWVVPAAVVAAAVAIVAVSVAMLTGGSDSAPVQFEPTAVEVTVTAEADPNLGKTLIPGRPDGLPAAELRILESPTASETTYGKTPVAGMPDGLPLSLHANSESNASHDYCKTTGPC